MALLAVAALGIYKAFIAISKGHTNIIFLIILGVIGFGVIYFVSFVPRISKLGKTYLQRLQLTFESLKDDTLSHYSYVKKAKKEPRKTSAGIDPMLLSVGVFGGGILAGTTYNSYNLAFKKSNNERYSSSGCCAGCGCGDCRTSSSSWSSCSSSSSCSSCSSCGGGCGGCS